MAHTLLHPRPMIRPALGLSILLFAAACTSTPDETVPERALRIQTNDACRAECGVVPQNRIELVATATGDLANGPPLKAESSSSFSAVVAGQTEECDDRDGERTCWYRVAVDTMAAGDALIVFRDSSGKNIDAISLVVREPSKVVVDVEGAGPRQSRPGRTILFRDQSIELGVTVLDASEGMLRYSAPPWKLESSDPALVSPDPANPRKAKVGDALGSATLTLKVGTVSQPIELDIVER